MGFFNFFKRDISEEEFQEQQKVKRGLEKTRTGFFQRIVNTLTNAQIDDDLYDQLEEQLILADVGPACAVRLVDELHDEVEEKHLKTGQEALDALRGIICQELTPRYPMDLDGKPAVILVIGVNGVGKTTSIAKLADYYTRQGKRVMLAAGDTFRAAASEQLEIWADRAGVPIVKAGEGADPAAVIFDTVKSATARGYDMVIADTAGRLHNKSHLMEELRKISRVITREYEEAEVRTLLAKTNIVNIPFSEQLPLAQLHWLIADKTGSIVVESTADGLHIYDNPVGVLTNNPPFPQQLFALNNYRALSPRTPAVAFADGLDLPVYSRGLGAPGLPGDLSSQSRFVRAAFVRMNAKSGSSEAESVGQFFHILHAVEQQRGCCELDGGKYEITLYTSCCNADRGIYYYTTYGNHQITAVDMHRENLDGDRLVRYPLVQGEQIALQN